MKDHGADVCFFQAAPLAPAQEEVARLLDLK